MSMIFCQYTEQELQAMISKSVEIAMRNMLPMMQPEPKKAEPVVPEKLQQEELTTQMAKEYLKILGYRVCSFQGFQSIMDKYGITGEKKGKQNWYRREDLNKIPAVK